MSSYKYIIVGGGMTADAAARGIREIDGSGPIAIFGEEPDPPYNRPPLSKGLWKGDSMETIWRERQHVNLDLFGSTRITALDPTKKTVRTQDGSSHQYEKLLLATGGRPRTLPFGGDDIIYFRTLDDYRKLRSLAERVSDFVVVGGGFIGSEVAAALTTNGKRVTMIFPDDGIGVRMFPRELATFVTSYYAEKGVNVLSDDSVKDVERKNGRMFVKTVSGEEILTDAVVAGLGITPNDTLAKMAGLPADNGIIVDEHLRTTDYDIFAAGDVASFHSRPLNKRMRVEHEDNANAMGATAGHNMAGSSETYDHLPFFYSDLFDLGYEAVGEIDPRLETIQDWEEEYRKGVVYYLRDGEVKGALLWNTWGKVDAARELIASGHRHSKDSLKALIRE